MSEYFNKLDTLWKEFDGLTNLVECTCEAGAKYNDHSKLMKLMQFLSGIDDSFNQVESHILLMDLLRNVKSAFSIVSREESHLKNGTLSSSSNVTKTQSSTFNNRVSDKKNQNTISNKGRNQNLQCRNCGLKGHLIEKCYKLIGYPKDFKFRNETNNDNMRSQNKSFSFNSSSVPSGSSSFFSVTSNVTGSGNAYYLTSEQYNKLLSLINEKSSISEDF